MKAYALYTKPTDFLPIASMVAGDRECPAGWVETTCEELAAQQMSEQGRLYEAWYLIREERNRRLTACDWRMLPDAPGSAEQRAAWVVYRAALRDLPDNTPDPAAVVWPTPPEDV